MTMLNGATPHAGQAENPVMQYPRSTWQRRLYRLPLWLWRLGWGPLLGRYFVVLTTTGRKSGLPRRAMLEYSRLADGRIVLASAWGDRADWVKNAQADPIVTVQTASGTHSAQLRRAQSEADLRAAYAPISRSPMWAQGAAVWGIEPDLDSVLAHPERTWFFICQPGDYAAPPGQKADLWWVSALVAVNIALNVLAALVGKRKR